MKRLGFALAAFASPRLATKAGGSPSTLNTDQLEPFVEMGGKRISGKKALAAKGLKISIEKVPYPSGERYNLSLSNSVPAPQVVDRVGLVLAAPPAGRERDWRVFLDVGGSGWCGVKRLGALGPYPHLQPVRVGQSPPFHRSDLQTVVWDAKSGEAVLVGFLRQRYGRNKVDIIPNQDARGIARFEAWQEIGFEFPAAHTQILDPLVIAKGNDPLALLEGFGSAVKAHHGREFDGPPIVGMDTWYGYRDAITEEVVLANARIIGELFGGYPQKMQNLLICDHGWQQNANWGYWEPDTKRFPHGMKWLSEQLAKEGVDLGFWTTPFWFSEDAPNHKDLVPL